MFSASSGRRTAEQLRQEKIRNIGNGHNSTRWKEGVAGKLGKRVGRMENKKALERRGKEKGKRVKKLHANPTPPQEQET